MGWDIVVGRKFHTVSTHLGDNVFPEDHYLLRTVLDPTRVRGEGRIWQLSSDLLCYRVWYGRSAEQENTVT